MTQETNIHLSLVIPLYNEEGNVKDLVESFNCKTFLSNGLKEILLINNGSTDNTARIVDSLAQKYSFVKTVHLDKNLNYGGGIWYGLNQTKTEFIGYLPGDGQIIKDDVQFVWNEFKDSLNKGQPMSSIFKGRRDRRTDDSSMKIVSKVYSFLTRMILGVPVKDINGLPKIFHRSLLEHYPEHRYITFTFDAQTLFTAHKMNWQIVEKPVTFYRRGAGVSSWSGKRFQVYFRSIIQIIRLRMMKVR